jgi:hypothetical protein
MRIFGLMMMFNGLLLIAEGLFVGALFVLLQGLAGFGPQKGPPPTRGETWLIPAILIAGAVAAVWGSLLLLARRSNWLRFGVAAAPLGAVIGHAVLATPIWLLPWFLVGPLVVGYVSWAILCYEEKLPGSPWLDEVQAPPPAMDVPPLPDKKVVKMVASLKGGRDRKTDRDVESWD